MGYRDGKDLNDKTIAVNGIGNIAHIAVRAWLDKKPGASMLRRSTPSGIRRSASLVIRCVCSGVRTTRFQRTLRHPCGLRPGVVRATHGEKLMPDLIQPDVDVAAKYGISAGRL
jgi:glutamate dehydrogenase/leucine dehydrogenase